MHRDELADIRAEARAFEKSILPERRKALGQFFTGAKVARLLAHIAVGEGTHRVLDPMAGTGDLLDAANDVASHCGNGVVQLHAIEVNADAASRCRRRLACLGRQDNPDIRVLQADAFNPATYSALAETGYDLVIANPPYVRYQSTRGQSRQVRNGLTQVASKALQGPLRELWATLVAGYSGLSDLSIPSWLVCGLLVKPGGRLALVAPATWRSRSYATVVRYLMLRAFRLQVVVEDSHPGWFPDALVGTHLIVAERLPSETAAMPLSSRTEWPEADWVKVHSEAASDKSVVGRAFACQNSEAAFSEWLAAREFGSFPTGITTQSFSSRDEWDSLRTGNRPAAWLKALEPLEVSPPQGGKAVFRSTGQNRVPPMPNAIRDLLPTALGSERFRTLEQIGVRSGQGLRTGCNAFFYVQPIGEPRAGWSKVTTSTAFGTSTLNVPSSILKPVLHRQAEIDQRPSARSLTHVLDLRQWVLPEDFPIVKAALSVYRRMGHRPPSVMPDDLARHVRSAACTPLPRAQDKPASALSAVRTNARPARSDAPPRFWYMLPDFAPRHIPSAFIPRVIHSIPQSYSNTDPKLLIDANFSTLWSSEGRWSAHTLAALLNSAWCRVLMEATGTRLGGGALKLEASHLRDLLVPCLTDGIMAELQAATLADHASSDLLVNRAVLRAILPAHPALSDLDAFTASLNGRADYLQRMRRGLPPQVSASLLPA